MWAIRKLFSDYGELTKRHNTQGRHRRRVQSRGGQDPAVLKTAGDEPPPPEIWIFQSLFS